MPPEKRIHRYRVADYRDQMARFRARRVRRQGRGAARPCPVEMLKLHQHVIVSAMEEPLVAADSGRDCKSGRAAARHWAKPDVGAEDEEIRRDSFIPHGLHVWMASVLPDAGETHRIQRRPHRHAGQIRFDRERTSAKDGALRIIRQSGQFVPVIAGQSIRYQGLARGGADS